MVTVKFNPNGGPLTASAVFAGNMIANYEMLLRNKDSNSQVTIRSGDNINPEDDKAQLPTPADSNDGRRVILETGFYGNAPAANPNYEIRLEIFQDDALIGFVNETGTLKTNAQYSLLFIRLTK